MRTTAPMEGTVVALRSTPYGNVIASCLVSVCVHGKSFDVEFQVPGDDLVVGQQVVIPVEYDTTIS